MRHGPLTRDSHEDEWTGYSREGFNIARRLPRRMVEEDEHLTWMQKPHTVLALCVILVVSIYYAFTMPPAPTFSNLKTGFCAMALVYLVICVLYLHDGPFLRPHPIFWRVVNGICIIYLLSLVVILFQNADDVRQFLRVFDESLGKPLPERSYAEDCRLYTPEDPESRFRNLRDTVHDEFFLAHIIGWFFKTLILRDWRFCLAMSFLFEVWEYTMAFMLPNFHECWWDHFILDFLVCNNLGIITGMLVLRYFLKMKEYNWTGWKYPPILRSLGPSSIDAFGWDWLASPRRFIGVLFVGMLMSVADLNAFFLKWVFWVPPPHPLNVFRLFLILIVGAQGLREFFQWISYPRNAKLGFSAWYSITTVTLEAIIAVKFGWEDIPWYPPREVWIPWVIFIVGLVAWFLYYFFLRGEYAKKRKDLLRKHKEELSQEESAGAGRTSARKRKTKKSE